MSPAHSEEQTDKGGGVGGSCDWCYGVLQEGKYSLKRVLYMKKKLYLSCSSTVINVCVITCLGKH